MNYLAIFLGLVMAVIPSYWDSFDKENKRITLAGIALILVAVAFIIVSFCQERINEIESKENKLQIDSLKALNINCILKVDSLKDVNYEIKDSLLTMKGELLEKDKQIYESVQDFRKETKNYQEENKNLQTRNSELLNANKRVKILGEEPSVATLDVRIGAKNSKARFPLRIIAENSGKRDAEEFKVNLRYFFVAQDKIILEHSKSSDDAKIFEVASGKRIKIDREVQDFSAMNVSIIVLIEYRFKDKLQGDKILGDEDVYLIRYEKDKCTVTKGLDGDYQKVLKYIEKEK